MHCYYYFKIFQQQSVQWVWIVWNYIVQKLHHRISRALSRMNLQSPKSKKTSTKIFKKKLSTLQSERNLELIISIFSMFFSVFRFVGQLKIENHFLWTILWPTFNRKHTLHAFGIQFSVRVGRSPWSYLRWSNTTNPIQIINLC